MTLTCRSNLTTLPADLYPLIFTHLNSGQLCIISCVSKAMAQLTLNFATSHLKGGFHAGEAPIPTYLREKLKWKVLAQYTFECDPTKLAGATDKYKIATATCIEELKKINLCGSNSVNLSHLFEQMKYQENHFLKCPFIAIYDLRTGHLNPSQLEHAIRDTFRYAEVCGKQNLTLVSTLLFNHPNGPKIDIQQDDGLGALLRDGICRLSVDYWNDEDRLRIVKMFFSHPNGMKIPASDLQTITKYIGETSDSELAETIRLHPNAKNSGSGCTIL